MTLGKMVELVKQAYAPAGGDRTRDLRLSRVMLLPLSYSRYLWPGGFGTLQSSPAPGLMPSFNINQFA